MQTLGHLRLQEIRLQPGQEWAGASGAWQFLRLHRGAAYWLGGAQARSLIEGEMLVIAPACQGAVRASQINEVVLHGFHFAPDMLYGLFTVAERHFFEKGRDVKSGDVRFFPSTHPTTQRLAALATAEFKPEGLATRLKTLGIVAEIFDEEMARHRAPESPTISASHRFQQIIAQMPDSEIANHPPAQLARLCGCSPRHFTRLFRKEFGESVRSRQTELRLLKARQLLSDSTAKIIEVAFESGYRNLSLFNSLFKRRFGVTPSEWRAKAKKNGALLCALGAVALLFLSGAPALAGEAPPQQEGVLTRTRQALRQKMAELDAQENLILAAPGTETNAPVAAETSRTNTTFQVKGYEMRGNTLLPRLIIEPILQKHMGTVTFDSIRTALAELQIAYRERGYVTVAASLPLQQLTNGIVTVQIIEGRLAEINVLNNRHVSSNNIMRELPSVHTNQILNGLVFQQELDRANANRDRQIYPVISPGPEPGTSVLDLKVKDRLPLHAHAELNNYSTPNTPELRANLAAVDNNLWQLNHQFGLQYSFSPEAYKPGGYNFYDRPLIANYSAYYRLPLSGVNGPLRQTEYSLADFGYDEATRRFRPPPSSGANELLFFASRSFSDTGQQLQSRTLTPNPLPPTGGLQVDDEIVNRTLNPNEDVGARFSVPLAPARDIQSTLSAGLDFKNYRSTLVQNHSFQATVFVPAFGSNGPPWDPPNGFQSQRTNTTRTVFTSVQYLPLSFNWDVSVPDRQGSTTFTLGESFNLAGLLSGSKNFQQVAGSTHANGKYLVVSAGLTREQKLGKDWGVRLHADGQWANQPLISNEQFSLGGQAGVRGYRDGAEYGDRGWRVQLEPHSAFRNLGLAFDKIPMIARFYGFADYGERYLIDPGARKSAVAMLGTGAGIDLSIGEHWDLRVAAGVPLLDTPGQSGLHVRSTFSLAVQF